jgi:ABC-type phosphate/phosphonate transport system substrate-binding protein
MYRGKRFHPAGILRVIGLVAALLATGAGAPAQEAPCVRIGVISSHFRDTSERLMQVIMRPFASLVESQTGVSGQLVAGGDAQKLSQRLKKGEVQFGIFHSAEFAWARAKSPELKPLVIAVNKQPFLRAHLIVARDSKVARLEDLKGKVLAMPHMSRAHCWLFLERRCVPEGDRADNYFGRLTRPRDAAYAIDDVIDGAAQAAVIDDVDLAAYRKQYPEYFAKVKILQQSESFPCAVIAYYPGWVSEDLLDQFRTGMLAAKSTRRGRQMLQMCRITSFEEVPEDYEEQLREIARAYPPPSK